MLCSDLPLNNVMHHPPWLDLNISTHAFPLPFFFFFFSLSGLTRGEAFLHSSPPTPSHLQGPHQTRWQPQPAWRWGSFSSSNQMQRVLGASRSSSSAAVAASFITGTIKKDLIE